MPDVSRETRNHEKTTIIFRATRDVSRVALRVELCVVLLPREQVSRAISLTRASLGRDARRVISPLLVFS